MFHNGGEGEVTNFTHATVVSSYLNNVVANELITGVYFKVLGHLVLPEART